MAITYAGNFSALPAPAGVVRHTRLIVNYSIRQNRVIMCLAGSPTYEHMLITPAACLADRLRGAAAIRAAMDGAVMGAHDHLAVLIFNSGFSVDR